MKKFFTLFAAVAMMFAASAETLDLCKGESLASSLPIYGLWADTENTTGQMIYSAEMLAPMAGCDITAVKFYTSVNGYEELGYEPQNGASDYINFSGATIQLSFKVVEQGVFTEAVAIEGATAVAVTTPESGDRYLIFELEEPFHYEGGNLLVEAKVITAGSYGTTYFWVQTTEDESTPGFYSYEGYSGLVQYTVAYLPAITFTYEASNETKYYITGGFNGWEAENPVELTEEGYTFNVVENTEDVYWDCFKLLTAGEEDWTWIGGIDEEGVGYFAVTEELMTSGQELTLYDDGVNFRLPGEGSYTVTLVREEGAKAALTDVKIVVAKANEPTPTAVNDINSKAVAGVKYYNLAGVESNKPFDGVNIMVTTYTDGTKAAAKVVK